MPRKSSVRKREITPDALYGDELLAEFINHVMRDGKKSLAERIVYDALDIIQARLKRNPLEVFKRALENVQPTIEVKSRRVGGATYQIPVEVRSNRAKALGMRWLVHYASERSDKNMAMRLAAELMDAADEEGGSRGKGGAVKKRDDTHRMAEANKAFAHYRW
jgi:small subunit ribosomal protein S7